MTAAPLGPGTCDPAGPGARNRYTDLLRVLAIGTVVLGHWLLTSISYRGGLLSGASVMAAIGWSGWATLLFQVMPVFFLVGGYANALSWTRQQADGAARAQWVRHRAIRLLRPTTVFVAVVVTAVAAGGLLGADPAELALAAWGVALQLWFLPVYLLLIALTPALHAAHRRWGFAVPGLLALGAAGVDAGLLGARLPGIGYANYLLVWGTMHQWGFAWQDGTLTRRGPAGWRWRPWALAACGAVALGGLLAWGPFGVNMVGTAGGRANNTIPPSVALLAFAAVQAGLLIAAEPAMSRLLARGRLWRAVSWLNARVLTVYRWHMVPVVLVAGLLILTAVTAFQLRAVSQARYPSVRATEALAATLPLFVLLFAWAYLTMARNNPANFNVHPLTRTDVLYFTVTVFSTVGFGDILAVSELARVVVMAQMLLDLLILGLVVRVFVGAVQLARQQPAGQAGTASGQRPRQSDATK